MSVLAVHGDGALRLKYEFRPSTWVSHGIQALCGIQFHKIRKDGSVRPTLFYRGWRYRVQAACFKFERITQRFI
jgi:hypothetical protein